jgi:murein DD-endopeptidase MepM/ murein hydrolase activator NlpD
VTRDFRAPVTEYAPGHRGIDLAARPGDGVLSARAGRVSFVGNVAGTAVVSIEHDSGWVTSYLPVISNVALNQQVSEGESIGSLAPDESHCSCLHFGVRYRDGYVSPLLVLGQIPRAVILPW